MNDNITLFYAVLVSLVAPLTGGMILFATSHTRNQSHLLLRLLAVGNLAISALGLFAVVGWGLYHNSRELILMVVGDSLATVLLLAVGWTGWQILQLDRRSSSNRSTAEQLDHSEHIGTIRTTAWCMVGLPLMQFAPLSLPLFAVMFALMEGPTSARRAKQGHLLWLLAIAVRRKQPLPPLLESFGKSLSGNQAFSIWRFVRFPGRSRYRKRIQLLADRLRDGLSLPDALADTPGLLPRTTLATIQVGHESGCLPKSLDRTTRQHFQSARQAETVSGISTFFIYTAVLLSATVAAGVLLTVTILPRYREIFYGFHTDLPGATIGLLKFTDTTSSHLMLANTIVAIPCLGLILLGIRWFWDPQILPLPSPARWWPRLHSSGVFRNLSLALDNGRPLDLALSTQIGATQTPGVAARLERVRVAVAAGESGWSALRTERMINSREQDLLECAERLGNLPWALQLIADSSERRLHHRGLWAFQLVRPVVVVAIGLVVGYVCIGLFLPLAKIIYESS